ncbi:MAG: hypothetical protein CFE26_21875, partial [Verrucomicrobiales bacterium VVV1]
MVNSSGNTGVTMNSTLNLAGHTANVKVSTLTMASRTGTTTGGGATSTLTFDQGALDVTTLLMANRASVQTNVTATVNLGDSAAPGTPTVTIGGVTMAVSTNSTGSATANLNITGGNVGITSINMGTAGTGAPPNAHLTQPGGTPTLGDLNGGGTLSKTSSGNLVLSGTNAFTGSLAVAGGTLTYSGTTAKTLAGLTVNPGTSVVTNTNAGSTNILNVGPITRNAGGFVNFANATATDNVIQTSTANTNGILGPWAFVGSDWAMRDGSGNIVAYTGYSDVA